MMNKIKLRYNQIKALIKKYPILFLLIVLVIVFAINTIIINLFNTSNTTTPNVNEVIDTSKSTGSVKPENFPDNKDLLVVLPEYNEYFTATALPLSTDFRIAINVELYKTDSQTRFNQWIQSNFTNTENIDFIFQDNPAGMSEAFRSQKIKYSELLKLIPLDEIKFSIRAEDTTTSGLKFQIFYNNEDPTTLTELKKFLEGYNLYGESLTISEFAPFKQPLDTIGE